VCLCFCVCMRVRGSWCSDILPSQMRALRQFGLYLRVPVERARERARARERHRERQKWC
jgi:thymidylate kinase